jgi:hypothetical protein
MRMATCWRERQNEMAKTRAWRRRPGAVTTGTLQILVGRAGRHEQAAALGSGVAEADRQDVMMEAVFGRSVAYSGARLSEDF